MVAKAKCQAPKWINALKPNCTVQVCYDLWNGSLKHTKLGLHFYLAEKSL